MVVAPLKKSSAALHNGHSGLPLLGDMKSLHGGKREQSEYVHE